MSPDCQIDGKARHEWMDAEVECETGESGSLHDVIAPYHYQGQETDPSEEVARNLDWESFLASDLIEFFGEDVIRRLLVGVKPGWESDLRMSRERHLRQVAGAAETMLPKAR